MNVNGGIGDRVNGPLPTPTTPTLAMMESAVEARLRPSSAAAAATRMLTFGMDRLLSTSKSSKEEQEELEEEENEGDDDGEG